MTVICMDGHINYIDIDNFLRVVLLETRLNSVFYALSNHD